MCLTSLEVPLLGQTALLLMDPFSQLSPGFVELVDPTVWSAAGFVLITQRESMIWLNSVALAGLPIS